FRTGLDRMSEELQQAASSGHTQAGGQLTPVTRALAGAAGTALKMVPVGKDLRETAAMAVTTPEFGPEAKALSKEIKAGRAAETAAPKSPFRIAAETPEKHA